MNEDANIFWNINQQKNVEFPSPKVSDAKKKITEKDEGTTYKKLLCIAFDLAITISYLDISYYRFVYHDDIFTQQDNNVKIRLLNLINKICEEYKFQYIISVVHSDLSIENGKHKDFSENEKY